MLQEILKAPEQVLKLRRQALVTATSRFFSREYDVKALVFIGTVLYKEDPRDTDVIVISRPQFILTTQEIDTALAPLLLEAAEKK